MACVQLNHSIPHRNSFHPGDYIVDNRRHGVLKSLQGIHLDKSHLGCSNWQHYGYWCNHGDGVSNRHHSLAKCEHHVELSTEHDSVSKQWDNFEYLNVECDSQHHIGRVFYNRRSSVSNRQLLCRSLPDWVQYIEHLAFHSHVDPCYTRRNRFFTYRYDRSFNGTSSTNSTTSPSLPPFPVTNSTSSPSTLGSITGTIPGTGGTPIPTLTGGTSAGSGTVTGLPTPTTEPPFPTRNGTSTAEPTGTAPPEGSGTIFFTTEPPETSSGLNATATTPPFPAGNITVIPVSTGNSRPPHHANPYSLAVCNIDAAVPNFKRHHCAYCHRDWSSTWHCNSERSLQPVAELNILVAAIFVVVVFASLPSHWVFDYPCHFHQLDRADGVFNTMPYCHRNQWHGDPSYYQKCSGLIHANLHVQVAEHDLYKALNRCYKHNTATTLITSTTKASVSAEGDSTTMFEPDGPVVPTTTVSDFTLPSNKAYPWGGNGPLFRRPNTTATDSEEVPVRQPGGWWLRWKRHFDRSRSSAKDRGADVTHET
ncbi:hypothetical protein CGCA056_v012534 [Colletotrichum aenigma]|uniref:uncharacterized protein n=1 Tax=Colletotrichum aenigma TaxID=1215731 RepID=UPI0018728983|nr:uncharacterized protein CGCA056_v012534 [Colletotrichum aenigma]KAF5511993.1 hypothetical protein CGCA056_v012534 [Colletotrichum aenigma]